MMLIRHRDQEPVIDPQAYVAPSAVVVGAVRLGPGVRVLHGAVLTAEDGEISIGENTVVMEHSLIRARTNHPVRIGHSVMIGPHTHINGSTIDSEAFIATGASLFPGSQIGVGAEVRINGVVQVNSTIAPHQVVPIGWVAVGTPATILPPDKHDEIWAIQQGLNFSNTVYGVDRTVSMSELMQRQSEYYGPHATDTQLSE